MSTPTAFRQTYNDFLSAKKNPIKDFMTNLINLPTEDWGIKSPTAAEAMKACIKTLPQLIKESVTSEITQDKFEDYVSAAVTKSWETVKIKTDKDKKSRSWNIQQWIGYITTIMSTAISEEEYARVFIVYTPKPIKLAIRKLERVIAILKEYLLDNPMDILKSKEFIAVVEYLCPLNGKCPHTECICGFDECPLPIQSMFNQHRIAIEDVLFVGPSNLVKKAKHYKVSYERFIKFVIGAYKATLPTKAEPPETYDEFDLENLIDFYTIKESLDKHYSKTVFNKTKNAYETIGLTDIYLYQIADQNLDEILNSNELEIPQRWQGKEIVERYGLENHAELRKLLLIGDQIINQYRAQNNLPQLKRVSSKEESNTHSQEAICD